jgi:HSP20 family protein
MIVQYRPRAYGSSAYRSYLSRPQMSRDALSRHTADSLHRQVHRLLNELVGPSVPHTPAIAMEVREQAVVLKAELPGVAAENLDIQVTPQAVAIAGHYAHRTPESGPYHSELRSGSFRRTVNLPVTVQYDQVDAVFQDGILVLTLPRAEAPKPLIHRVQLVQNPPAVPDAQAADAQETDAQEMDAQAATPESSPSVPESPSTQLEDLW